jgi:hypothetical protein
MKRAVLGWVRRLLPLALLILLYWVIRYFHVQQFGLYEDDLTDFPTVFGMSWEQIVRYATDPGRISALREHGRPLHKSFIYLLSGIGWRLSGLSGPYWIGFVVQSVNIALFYWLLKRIHRSALAIPGTLVYVLYSADTTQAYLTHSLGLHPSLTFLLLALNAYLSDRRVLSYVLASFTLLTYESTYLVFLAAPMLKSQRSGSRGRRWLIHVGVTVGILALLTYARIRLGDDRIAMLQGWEQFIQPARNALVGPAVSLGTFLYRPYQAATSQSVEALAVALIISVFLFFLFSRLPLGMTTTLDWLRQHLAAAPGQKGLGTKVGRLWSATPQEVRDLMRIALAGAVMLVLAYPLMLTVRPYAISGRETRVHAAGVVGAGLLIGALLMAILWVAEGLKKRRWIAAPLAIWLGLLAGYGFVIQNDYVMAWEYQQQFWREVLPLIPDIEEGEAILIDPGALQDTQQIGANYWNTPVVLEQLFDFPDEWERPPRVFRLSENWRTSIMRSADTATLNEASTYASPSTYYFLHMKDTILIVERDGRLVRLVGPVLLERQDEWLGTAGESAGPPYPKALLYGLMFGGARGGTAG